MTPRRIIALPLSGLLLLTGCATSAPSTAQTGTPEATDETAHWSYEGDEGPDAWGDLSEDWAACATGSQQSPVDLPAQPPAATETVTIDAGELAGTVEDTGHSLQFTPFEADEAITIDDAEFELAQLHVHTPAEHTIAGATPAAEVHLVHKAEDRTLVVGVLVELGEPSDAWSAFIDAAEQTADAATASDEDVRLSTHELLPDELSYYTYDGSLTTPPCSEPVEWIVLADTVQLSQEQIAALTQVHDHNARPTQDLNGRTVSGGTLVVED